MKVLLHGATNKKNFGDFLYAYIVFEELRKQCDVFFWEDNLFGLSDFFKKYLEYDKQKSRVRDYDALVYIPGGYLCEKNKDFRHSIIRYFRYYRIGYKFKRKNKRIAFIGVGGSPVNNRLLRNRISEILDYSNVVVVRDKKTKNYWDGISRKQESNIVESSDMILSLDIGHLPSFDINMGVSCGIKTILLHLSGEEIGESNIKKNVIPAINSFIRSKPDYRVLITYDNTPSEKSSYEEILKMIECSDKTFYNYDNPWKLIELIKASDMIVTPKLHVGVVSAMFGKSVISLPIDYNKTSRFYDQIGEPGRCLCLGDTNPEIILKMFKYYHAKKIIIPKKMLLDSKKNLSLLIDFINRVRRDEK